jgi:hypothetical protein
MNASLIIRISQSTEAYLEKILTKVLKDKQGGWLFVTSIDTHVTPDLVWDYMGRLSPTNSSASGITRRETPCFLCMAEVERPGPQGSDCG